MTKHDQTMLSQSRWLQCSIVSAPTGASSFSCFNRGGPNIVRCRLHLILKVKRVFAWAAVASVANKVTRVRVHGVAADVAAQSEASRMKRRRPQLGVPVSSGAVCLRIGRRVLASGCRTSPRASAVTADGSARADTSGVS